MEELLTEAPPRLTWRMSKKCNFNCRYCSDGQNKEEVKEYLPTETITNTLKKLGSHWILGITGGEPLLHPNFLELCKTVTKTNKIRFDTNLSLSEKIRDFAQNIDPANVYSIYAALHIEERTRRNEIDSFIENVLLLKRRNFNIRVNYVLVPNLIKKFMTDYKHFKAIGIILEPKPFTGGYNIITRRFRTFTNQTAHYLDRYFVKKYPDAYSEYAIETLMKFNQNTHMHTAFHSKDMDCSAGNTYLYMLPNGDIQRCPSDPEVIGSAFSDIAVHHKNEPCKVNMCLSYCGNRADIPEIIKRRDKKWTKNYKRNM